MDVYAKLKFKLKTIYNYRCLCAIEMIAIRRKCARSLGCINCLSVYSRIFFLISTLSVFISFVAELSIVDWQLDIETKPQNKAAWNHTLAHMRSLSWISS